MSEERKRILAMLGAGKITADEAEELLDAIEKHSDIDIKVVTSGTADDCCDDDTASKSAGGTKSGSAGKSASGTKPKFLRIMVEPKDGCKGEKVNIRVPMMLLKAGVKLASVIPGSAKNKINDKMKAEGIDIDLNKLDSKSLDEIVTGLGAICIDVDDDKEKVRIFCE